MNRPFQAKHFHELKTFAGVDSSSECYKPLRPCEISKSERNVANVVEILENEYLNPFSVSLYQNELYNLSSGMSKEDGVEALIDMQNNGKIIAEKFLEKRILTSEKKFHDPLPRVKVPSFQETTITIKRDKKVKLVYANRDIISKLLSLSAKFEKPVDFQKASTHPLYPFPLSMAFPDGSKRETQKSKLLQEILPDIPERTGEINIAKDQCVYVVDMIAQLRMCLSMIPDTFEQLVLKFVRSLPKGYHRIDIVADTYRNISIKSAERKKRGTSSKVLIGSIKSKLPRDMNKFMLNDENKTSLIKLIFDYVIAEKQSVTSMLKTEVIVLSGDDECYTVTSNLVTLNDDLRSNQE